MNQLSLPLASPSHRRSGRSRGKHPVRATSRLPCTNRCLMCITVRRLMERIKANLSIGCLWFTLADDSLIHPTRATRLVLSWGPARVQHRFQPSTLLIFQPHQRAVVVGSHSCTPSGRHSPSWVLSAKPRVSVCPAEERRQARLPWCLTSHRDERLAAVTGQQRPSSVSLPRRTDPGVWRASCGPGRQWQGCSKQKSTNGCQVKGWLIQIEHVTRMREVQ
jgi:hypothetical protein